LFEGVRELLDLALDVHELFAVVVDVLDRLLELDAQLLLRRGGA